MSSSSPSHSMGEEIGNLPGKGQTPESAEVIPESSSSTTHSNGSLSKDEARTMLASDTPTESGGELSDSMLQLSDVIPDSNDGLSQSQPANTEAPLFGRSATSAAVSEEAEHPGIEITEINRAKSPARVVSEASVKILDNEPEVITLSSSSSTTDSPTTAVVNLSADELRLNLDSQSDMLNKAVEASTKPKPIGENAESTTPKTTKASTDTNRPKSDKEATDAGKEPGGDDKTPDKASEDKAGDKPKEKKPADKDIPLPVGDIEEPIKVKYITPLGEPEGASANPEISNDQTETADKSQGQDEEKEPEEDIVGEDAEEVEESPKKKRGGSARSRGKGRGSRRGRVSARGRSPRQKEREEHEDDEEETTDPTAAGDSGKEKEASAEKEAAEDAGEEVEKEDGKSTSPKRKTRRTGFDSKLVAESKAQGQTPDQPESESRRVLRNRYQSPTGGGSEKQTLTPRRRRMPHSTSSGDELHDVDAEKPVRRKRGAAKAAEREPSPTPERHVRSKRARMSSGEQQQRSASSDSEPKEEKRARRTRGADTPEEVGESSKPVSTKRTSAARKRRSRGGAASATRKKTDDPFDFDDTADPAPAGPFRRVNLSKTNFGDMKFTKAFEKSGDKNKYTVTSKTAELKRQHTGDTVIKPDVTKVTQTLSPDLKRQVEKQLSNPSSGNLADVSTMSSGASLGKKQDSVEHKRYLDNPENIIDNDERPGAGRSSQSRRSANRSSSSSKGTPRSKSLFSDNDNDMADDHASSNAQSRGVKRNTRAEGDDGHTSGEESFSQPKKRRRTTDQVTPKPKEPKPLKLTPEEQLNADFPSQSTHALLPGARVLARWFDKCFYPATVMTDEGLGRYKIAFYDGAVRVTPRPDLVPVAGLKPGDVLMVNKTSEGGENELEPVKITNTPPSSDSEQWYDGIYEVRNEVQECTERIYWEKFVIDSEQTKHFVTTSVNKAAQDITADNITEKKERSTRSRGGAEQQSHEQEEPEEKEEVVTPRPRRSAPRTPRSPQPSRRSNLQSSAATSSTSSSSAKRRRGGEAFGRVSKVGSPTSRRYHQPPQIFAGLKFVLTSANRRTKENDASEEEKPSTITFNKKHVRSLIEDHGGLVVDEFSVIDLASCFLIADTHYRTHKYLSALARAVPCVKHTWIHDSCSSKELLDHANYMLAAGYSLESDKILPWHNKCPDLLADKSVLVYTENRPNNPGSLDFVQIWAPLVKCMGANVIETSPNAGTDKVDILLTDATCSPAQLAAAESRGAKAVSSEWLIQAIITGRQPRPDGHKKYEYDYVETAAAVAANAGAAAASGGSINENPTP